MFSKSVAAVVVAVAGFVSAGLAEETTKEPIGVGITADYFSKYIWRGQVLNDESVFQPSIYLSKYGFTGSVWGNLDMKDNLGNAGEFNEFDSSLDYTHALTDWLSGSVGAVYYDFPKTDFEDTTEIYGGLSLTKLPWTPSFKIYHDVDEIKGSYMSLGVGKTFEKIQKWSDTCYCGLALGASVGYGTESYNNGYFGVKDAAFNDVTLTAGLPICIGSWTVKPSINYAMMIDSDIREETGDSDNVWAGVGLSTSF